MELTLKHKAVKIDEIYKNANFLIASNHPATEEIKVYVTTLKRETKWMHDLLFALNVHIGHLQNYEEVMIRLTFIFKLR